MTGEAHGAVVTDPAVNTQVFLWHDGWLSISWLVVALFRSVGLLAVLGLHGCTGFSLVAASGGYSLVAEHSL